MDRSQGIIALFHYLYEAHMAATRKRTGARKRSRSKGASAKKRPARKAASRRGGRSRSAKKSSRRNSNLKRQARKGLRAAKGGIKTVRQVGERTWEVLKSTSAQVVGGVRDKMSESPET